MTKTKVKNIFKPVKITGNFYRLGTPSYPVYLSVGTDAMIIEGGIGAIANLLDDQLAEVGISPERLRYIALTHTHSDHIGAIPHMKKLWPHIQTVASPIAVKLLQEKTVIKDHVAMEKVRTKILLAKGEVKEPIVIEEHPVFNVDVIAKEGDVIDLGSGVKWTVCETPGHSPCHTSYYEEAEKIVSIGDATGFYVPEKDENWPNYFSSLEAYCNSIRKLYALSAKIGVLSHNYVIEGTVAEYLRKAMKNTEIYHHEMVRRIAAGEPPEDIAMEKAKWVNTLTDEHPFEIMYTLSKVLIKRSLAAKDKPGLFSLP
jgi:2-aminobenzoylacetyl-CoA thioesterase